MYNILRLKKEEEKEKWREEEKSQFYPHINKNLKYSNAVKKKQLLNYFYIILI